MISKFITYVGGVGPFGTVSICLFITVFSGALIWAWRQKKTFLADMSALPLHDGTVEATSTSAMNKNGAS